MASGLPMEIEGGAEPFVELRFAEGRILSRRVG
jgi:hypothetical protein